MGDLTPGAANATANPAAYAENVAGHALVGCVSSAASGGSCGSGALSGAVGSAISPITNQVFPDARTDVGERFGGSIIEATAGGLASVAGGGKFANGPVTGAFGYLFNAVAVHYPDGSSDGRLLIEGADSSYVIEGAIGLVYAPFRLAASILQLNITSFDPLQGILDSSNLTRNTQTLAQYDRSGNFDTAVSDFNSLGATNLRPISNNPAQLGGIIGDLSNGDTAVVRPTSSGGWPTLEIQRDIGADIKVRYK